MKMTSTTPSPLTSNLNRRLFVGAGALSALGLAAPARAMSVKDAETLIQKVVGEVLRIINSGGSEASILKNFEGIFRRYGDRSRIASSILGQPWRQANNAERSAYVEALTGYLARKYGKRFRDFEGGKIAITRSNDYGRKGIIVQTMVTTNKYAPFPVDWHVIEAGGNLAFFDIIIEGVKLLAAERAEIRAVLDRANGSMAALTSTLNKMG